MKLVLVILASLIFAVSFFVAILADNPLISIVGLAGMILAAVGITRGTES